MPILKLGPATNQTKNKTKNEPDYSQVTEASLGDRLAKKLVYQNTTAYILEDLSLRYQLPHYLKPLTAVSLSIEGAEGTREHTFPLPEWTDEGFDILLKNDRVYPHEKLTVTFDLQVQENETVEKTVTDEWDFRTPSGLFQTSNQAEITILPAKDAPLDLYFFDGDGTNLLSEIGTEKNKFD